jgi:hypothetical protein
MQRIEELVDAKVETVLQETYRQDFLPVALQTPPPFWNPGSDPDKDPRPRPWHRPDMHKASSYDRQATALSELTGQPVNTWSEEWRLECEARAVLKMPKEQREAYFNGVNGDAGQRGLIEIRGRQAAEALWTVVRRLQEIRAAKDRPRSEQKLAL